MSDEFSVFYVLHDLIPVAVVLGFYFVLVFGNLLIADGHRNNLTAKERRMIWIGFVLGCHLVISPSIANKILFDFASEENFCKFENGRDQRLKEPCVLHVKIKKAIEHRSGEQ